MAGKAQDLLGVDDAPVTLRELAVLRLMAEGLTNSEIGERLFITARTVKHHSASVRRKLGARTQAHAVALAYRRGLLGRSVAAAEDARPRTVTQPSTPVT